MRARLNKTTIDKLQPPTGNAPLIVRDTALPGFALRNTNHLTLLLIRYLPPNHYRFADGMFGHDLIDRRRRQVGAQRGLQ